MGFNTDVVKPGEIITMIAENAVSQYDVVKCGTDDEECTPTTAITDVAIGVAQNSAAVGEAVDIAISGVVEAVASATINNGVEVQVSSVAGECLAASGANYRIGIALSTGLANERFALLITHTGIT